MVIFPFHVTCQASLPSLAGSVRCRVIANLPLAERLQTTGQPRFTAVCQHDDDDDDDDVGGGDDDDDDVGGGGDHGDDDNYDDDDDDDDDDDHDDYDCGRYI
jgi:hypothetical protein